MAASSQHDDEVISGINVTPLVDIILVVLIIFIVTASMVLRHNIPVELPKAQTAEKAVNGLINLAISAEGQLYINGLPSDLDELPSQVASARKKATAAGVQVNAFISADVQARYGKFAAVVDRLRLAGVTDIALDTRPPDLTQENSL